MARTAKEIIDHAIAENRLPAFLLYGFSAIFVLAGVTVLLIGAIQGHATVALLGALGSAAIRSNNKGRGAQ